MIDFDNNLMKARIEWVLAAVDAMELKFKVAEISSKTGYSKSVVSNYLSKKSTMSLEFIKTFCDKYNYDFNAVNHMLIGKIKDAIQNNYDNSNDEKQVLDVPTVNKKTIILNPTKTGDTDMDTNFMKETVQWQRGVIDLLLKKIPDVEQVEEMKPPRSKAK